jgi:starch synthase
LLTEEGEMYPDNDDEPFSCKRSSRNSKKTQLGSRHHSRSWLVSSYVAYMKHFTKQLYFQKQRLLHPYSQSFDGTLDVEMINKVKFDGVPEDAIADLEILITRILLKRL